MKRLKSYRKFFESNYISTDILKFTPPSIIMDLNESLNLFFEDILKSVGSEQVNIEDEEGEFRELKYNFKNNNDLKELNEDVNFIEKLSSIGLKNSALQSTDDLETFVSNPCRFVMIYKMNSSELENPEYIIFQSKNENIKLYKITGEIKSFYDKLSSKVIRISHNQKDYIYQSSNKNEWNLQNVEQADEIFKKDFRKGDFEKFINDNKFTFDFI